jgi:hypothetical protein
MTADDVVGVLRRIADGDVWAVAYLHGIAWADVVQGMRVLDRAITRESAHRVLDRSRDPATRDAAWAWASLVRDGSLDPWILEDGFLVSRPTHPGQPDVEFTLEAGSEDAILDVIHRIDDINIDGPIATDEYVGLVAGLS